LAKKEKEEDEDEEDYKFTKEERDKAAKAYNESSWNNVFRSKGMIYVGTQPDDIFTWQTSGIVNEIRHMGKWLATNTKDELYEKGNEADYKSWSDKIQGDRKTQLVIIGSGIDKAKVTKCLDDCLMSAEEYAKMRKDIGIEPMVLPEGEEDPFRAIEMEEEWEDME